jgi:P-type Ca2+ transporter type 2C
MTTIHETPNGKVAYSQGRAGGHPGLLRPASWQADGEAPLDEAQRAGSWNGAQMASRRPARAGGGLQARATPVKEAEQEMTFLGLVGMIDPPRPEAKAAIAPASRPASAR